MESVENSKAALIDIKWPTEITEEVVTEMEAHLAENIPLELATVIVMTYDTETVLSKEVEILQQKLKDYPDRLQVAEWRIKLLSDAYMFGPHIVGRAKQFDLNGIEIPQLIYEYPGIEYQSTEQQKELEDARLRSSIWRWENDIKLLAQFQALGPQGLIDRRVAEYAQRNNQKSRGRMEADAAEKGRVRFHQLYTAF